MAPGRREGSRGACGRTGSRGGQPEDRAVPRCLPASPNAHAPRGALPCPCAVAWTPALALGGGAQGPQGARVLPFPRPCASLAHADGPPCVCGGRSEGPEKLRGHREPDEHALAPLSRWREPLKTCVVPSRSRTSRRQCRRHTLPQTDDAWPEAQRKTWEHPLSGSVCLLTTGVLIRVRPGMSYKAQERWGIRV